MLRTHEPPLLRTSINLEGGWHACAYLLWGCKGFHAEGDLRMSGVQPPDQCVRHLADEILLATLLHR